MHIFGTVIKKKKVIILGIIYILLLILVILAGKAKKMKLQEQVSQSDSRPITTEQVSVSEDSTEKTKASSDSYSSFDTASVLQTLASATEAKNNGLLTLVNMSHTLPADWTVDICSIGNQELDSSQEDTATQQWLMANCYKYGFILRYPADKSDITEISYEPWHYRYVGVEAATEMYQKHLCLEEYLEQHTN